MVINEDFKEFIELLNAHEVKYLVVGGYAVSMHGYPRYTKDIDFWIWLNETNISQLINAIEEFGFGSLELRQEDFMDPENIIQLGYEPNRIDLLVEIDGVEFESCYKNKTEIEIEGVTVNFINVNDLIKAKKTAGRLQDLADAENLEKVKDKQGDKKNSQ
ncbi:MAG: nucleotidyltransferase [Phaeodactylibacter sp.]|nr:nucleotidyltransferase [Phaeodactylibacter sp.]